MENDEGDQQGETQADDEEEKDIDMGLVDATMDETG